MVLEIEVTREEIKKAVWDCGVDKSPGPDGFTFGFYRRYWTFLEDDVVEAVLYFFNHGQFPKGDFERHMIRSWDYLDDVLKRFGFGEKWCGWIQNCLLSSKGSVIVNGSPTKEFQFHRGLKQGDPLSPFLFLLIMESLHISMQRVVDAGLFKGIQVGSSLQVSHLFYADDVVFMGHWSEANIDTILRVLDCFYHASGLRINMLKSKLMGISVCPAQGGYFAKHRNGMCNSSSAFFVFRFQSWLPYVSDSIVRCQYSIGPYFKVPANGSAQYGILRCHFFIWQRGRHRFLEDNMEGRQHSIDFAQNGLQGWCWKSLQYIQLMKIMEGINLFDSKDRWRWSLEGCGEFTVASVRNLLDANSLPVVSSKTRWIKAMPIKVNIHA
ncbi:RNA-directed DNA polymerase, eukaryota, reverse transcriptase zinc-binding domain protein [Tanacetum coccineum]